MLAWALLWPRAASAAGPPVLTDGGYPPLRLFPEQVEALEYLSRPPEVSARSALLVDLDTGQVLLERAANEPLPPASTVKVMTALLTLERGKMDDRVTVSAKAAATPGSRMGLTPGETLTVEELLYGLLLPSGNDAAVVLAEYVAGSEEAFVAMMNRRGAELGLKRSSFANAHGLDDPTQLISASDLVTITREALRFPAFAKIVATPSREVSGRSLVSTNELLGAYPGADGIKTGTTDEAGENLIASVNHDGHRTLAVLMGSQDRYTDARTLLDYAAAGWRWKELELPGGSLDWAYGSDGRAYRLRTEGARGALLPSWQWDLVQPERVLDASVPMTATQPIGSVRWRLGDEILADALLGVWGSP
jgi:D-alanyl-D-alanine carboxypeptidase (penicillin-binding protein 5/6)